MKGTSRVPSSRVPLSRVLAAEFLGGEAAPRSIIKIDEAVAKLREPGGLLAGLTPFENTFATARKIFGQINVSVPEAENFVLWGFDLAGLAGVYEAKMAAGDEVMPVLAPQGLGPTKWERIFEILGGPEISIATELRREFALLDGLQTGKKWSLRLIPDGQKPSVMGLNHSRGPHVSLAEMLTLQAVKQYEGAELVDQHTFTWLAGKLADGKRAARHIFDAHEQKIILSAREVGNQGPHTGARPPLTLS